MRRKSFADRFTAWSRRVDHLFKIFILTGLAILLGTQLLLANESTRNYLSYVYRAEGTAIVLPPDVPGDRMYLTIYLLNHPPTPEVKILINNRVESDFRENPAIVQVYFGDVVDIDPGAEPGELHFSLGSVPEVLDVSRLLEQFSACLATSRLGQIAPRDSSVEER